MTLCPARYVSHMYRLHVSKAQIFYLFRYARPPQPASGRAAEGEGPREGIAPPRVTLNYQEPCFHPTLLSVVFSPRLNQIDDELARARAELERKKEVARQKRERRKQELDELLQRGKSAPRSMSIDEDEGEATPVKLL